MALIVDFFIYLWNLFKLWIETIFVLPVQNLEMLWLLVPIWIAWFFSEWFQEKAGTSLGNAMSNSFVLLWGSVDCTRMTVNLIRERVLTTFQDIWPRFALIFLIFAYGSVIVYLGMKGNPLIRKLGRARQITYMFVLAVPVLYNVIPMTQELLLAGILFFPLFYFTIELIDYYTPDPKALLLDQAEARQEQNPPPQIRTNRQYPYGRPPYRPL